MDCPEGMYGDGATTPKCVECPIGQYNPLTKQSQCIACIDGKSTLTTGSDKEGDCTSIFLALSYILYFPILDSIKKQKALFRSVLKSGIWKY